MMLACCARCLALVFPESICVKLTLNLRNAHK